MKDGDARSLGVVPPQRREHAPVMGGDGGPVIPNFGQGDSCVTGDHAFCWGWVQDHWGDTLGPALWQHVELTVIAVVIGFAIAFPLALLAHRYRRLEQPFGAFSALVYTVPSLALFQFLVPFTGITLDDGRDRARRLHARDPVPEHRHRPAQRTRRRDRSGARHGAHAPAGADCASSCRSPCRRSSAACASPSSRRSRSRRSPPRCCRRASATRSSSR